MAGNTAKELLKALEERAKEIEALKRELQKCERERNQLETQKHTFDQKQPANVQLLLSQKRELQMQLEREESEKHELFSQINQLIGDVDDLKSKQDSGATTQLQELTLENDQLKKDFGRKEMAFQKVSEELLGLQRELERRERTHTLEKNRLAEEMQDYQREIEVKSAALESLSLVKQSSNDYTHLATENSVLRQELQEKEDLLRELTESNDELGQSLTESGAQMDGLNLQIAQLTTSLHQQTHDFVKNKQDMETQLAESRGKSQRDEHLINQLENELEKLKKENALLDTGMAQDMAALVESLKEARLDIGAKDAEIADMREQCLGLQAEMDGLMRRKSDEQGGDIDAAACEKCPLKDKKLKNSNAELAMLKQSVEGQQDLGALLEQLKVENRELSTQLQSKTDRLEKVEELVLRLESSLKLIESEHAKAKVVEMERLHQIEALNQQLTELETSFTISKDALTLNAAKQGAIIEQLTGDLENERLLVAEKSQQLLELQTTEEKNQILLKRIMNALEVEHVGGIQEDQEDLIVYKLISYKEQSKGLQKHLAEVDGMSAAETESMAKLTAKLMEAEGKNKQLVVEINQMKTEHSEEQKSEKDHWQEEATKLAQHKAQLEKRVEELEEKSAHGNDRPLLHRHGSDASSGDEGGSMKTKISKLMDENAQLAGDLLKQQTGMEQEFRKVLQQEKQGWLVEKSTLEAKLKQTEQQLEESAKRVNNSVEPMAKPRKLTPNGGESEVMSAPISHYSDTTTSTANLTDVSLDSVAVSKITTELEKQKRLVTVLRKKLQQHNIQATLQSRLETTSLQP